MSKNNISYETKRKLFERDNFTCKKCGFQDKTGEEIEPHHILLRVNGGEGELQNLITLCGVCHHFAPDSKEELERYISEKVDSKILDTFRKSNRSIAKRTKVGMTNLFRSGKLVTRAPLGYNLINNSLISNEKAALIEEIYQTFLNQNISLTQLAKKYNLSVNGLKKVLSNVTYLGKVKFAGQIAQGKHNPLISQELFDKVKEKLGG